jgi:hypothetical protein
MSSNRCALTPHVTTYVITRIGGADAISSRKHKQPAPVSYLHDYEAWKTPVVGVRNTWNASRWQTFRG